jgi:hypothetical protein
MYSAALICSAAVFPIHAHCSQALLEDTGIEVSSDVAVYSDYIWRGFRLDNDPVIQPGLYLSAYGIEASIWGSFDIDADDSLNSDEVDYSLGYSYDFSDSLDVPFTASGGFTYYDFPAANAFSKEFYLGCSLDVILSPAFTWYHDFGDEEDGGGDGDYFLAELSHSVPVSDWPVSLDFSAHGGYNRELFIEGDGPDAGFSAGITLSLSENCSVSPSVNYSIPLGDLEDSDDGNQDEQLYGGVVVTFGL